MSLEAFQSAVDTYSDFYNLEKSTAAKNHLHMVDAQNATDEQSLKLRIGAAVVSGDREAAHDFLTHFSEKAMAGDAIEPEIMGFVGWAIGWILEGADPKVALRLSSGRRGRPSVEDFPRKLVTAAFVLAERRKGQTLEVAIEKVAEREGISESKVKRAYLSHKKYLANDT